jgi:predicted TIM-barrel fold metal-dependent hydrolase
MKIDVFTHFAPRHFAEYLGRFALGRAAVPRWQRIPTLVDLDARRRLLDAVDGGAGDYVQVLSLPNPAIEAFGPPSETPEIARAANDALAELCAGQRDRFPAFVANLPMNAPDAAVREAERAVRELGAAGLLLYTNVLGAPLSGPEYFPVFEKAAELDCPIWLHPIRGPETPDYRSEAASQHEIWFMFGWPYETAAAMARLVYAGLFERLPGIKIITHHLGGLVPYLAGKIAMGFRQAGEGTVDENPVARDAGLTRPVLDYFRMFYADTAVNGVDAALACGLEFFGAERCLFASDAPFDPRGGAHLIEQDMRMLDAAALSSEARAAIYAGNAARLLGARL